MIGFCAPRGRRRLPLHRTLKVPKLHSLAIAATFHFNLLSLFKPLPLATLHLTRIIATWSDPNDYDPTILGNVIKDHQTTLKHVVVDGLYLNSEGLGSDKANWAEVMSLCAREQIKWEHATWSWQNWGIDDAKVVFRM